MGENYKIINGENALIISKYNGNSIFISKEILSNERKMLDLFDQNHFYEKTKFNNFDINMIEAVYINIHASGSCNLNCKYCFRDFDDNKSLTLEDSKTFIDLVINHYPNAKKYYVDPTGSGEPLMNFDLLLDINDYCKKKSNEIFREITVNIATNGTMLSNDIVETIQKKGIIFGVSLDGRNHKENYLRVTKSGKSVHKKVIKNVSKIKEKGFLGVAYTLTGQTLNLLEDIKYLSKYFPTISVKPVRSINEDIGISNKNIEYIKNMYDDLYNFLLKESYNGNKAYLFSLLDGDDYFGKYIYRVIRNIRVNMRCDAGIGRFSLAPNGNIYTCPAAIDIPDLVVGKLESGLDNKRIHYFHEVMSKKSYCDNCFAKYYCGGECLVYSYMHHNKIGQKEDFMCEYKRHIIKLALLFVHNLRKYKSNVYLEVLKFCQQKTKRRFTNNDIIRVAKTFEDKYTFTEIMRIEFEDKELFLNLLNKCKDVM